MTEIKLPELSLVVLIGTSGSGKSTFAAKHFAPTEVLSSDFCRALVGDDENDQSVTKEAFEILHDIAGMRLRLGRLKDRLHRVGRVGACHQRQPRQPGFRDRL